MKKQLILLAATALIALSGCGKNASPASGSITDSHSAMGSTMHHSDSGELPAGLKPALNPAFKIGSRATITTGHMAGMEGAQATIVGAFDTTAYAVTFTTRGWNKSARP